MKFTFQEKGHKYFLGDKPLTGVTSVLNVIAKPALIQWAADEAVKLMGWRNPKYPNPNDTALDACTKFMETAGDWTVEQWLDFLNEARLAHRRKKEEAGQKGTDVHALIEKYIKLMITDQGGISYDINGYEDYENNQQVINFIKWSVNNKVKFLESEKKMYSEKHWIAGTADFTCEIDGKKYLCDVKTGGIYDRIPFAQCAAYRFMAEEMGQTDFSGSIIINLKKDGKFDEKKDVYYSFDYQTDLDLFLSALKIYCIMNNY